MVQTSPYRIFKYASNILDLASYIKCSCMVCECVDMWVQEFVCKSKIKLLYFILVAFYYIKGHVLWVHFSRTTFILKPIEILKLRFNGNFFFKTEVEMHLKRESRRMQETIKYMNHVFFYIMQYVIEWGYIKCIFLN